MSSRKQRQIEDEFGEPFWDIVKGFADAGESIYATAFIIGMSPPSFRRLVRRHGHETWFVRNQESVGAKKARAARRGQASAATRRATRAASAENPCYRRVEIDGITDTIAGHARRRGVRVRTAYNRLYRGLSAEAALFRGSYTRPPASNAGHTWRTT